jgi:hypothetical protein
MMTVDMHVAGSKTFEVDAHDGKCEGGVSYTVFDLSHRVDDGIERVTVFVEPRQLMQIRDEITAYFGEDKAAEAAGR